MIKSKTIITTCKRCGNRMLKYQRPPEIEAGNPFPFDRVCGHCLLPAEVAAVYPKTKEMK